MRTTIRRLMTPLLLTAGIAHSADWKIEPTISLSAGYNDNIRMSTNDKTSSAEASLSPSAKFSVETPQSGLSGDLRFEFRRFKDDSNLNDETTRFLTNAYHRMERSRLGLEMGLIKDTTLDSQQENTGLVVNRVTRYQVNVGPSWTYNLDERTNARIGYNYSDVQYTNNDGSGLVDFHVNGGQASLQRVVNERTVASINLTHSQTSNDNQVDTKNTSLQAGGSYRFSETLSASLFVGVRRNEADFSQSSLIPIFSGNTIIGFIPLTEDVSRSDSGYTFSGSLTKRFLRGQTGLSVSRNVSNDANGIPVEVTTLRWNNSYRFSETLSAELNLSAGNSKTGTNAGDDLSQDSYTFAPRLNWDFQQFWTLSGSYLYRKQSFDSSSDDAAQNVAYLTLTYRWPRMAISR